MCCILLILRLCGCTGCVLGMATLLRGSESQAQDEPQVKERLEFMKAEVDSFELESSELKPKAAFTFVSKPLLRYSDPTRGGGTANEAEPNVLLDAGVWRLGTEGRPIALVTVEIYQAPDASRVLAFEFLSLSETKYSLKHKTDKIRWEPTGSSIALMSSVGRRRWTSHGR